MSEPADAPAPEGEAKPSPRRQRIEGLFKTLSSGLQQLITLDKTLSDLAEEDKRFRGILDQLRQTVSGLVGTLGEMDKRVAERFAELDKRLAEADRRQQAEIKLAVREEMDRRGY